MWKLEWYLLLTKAQGSSVVYQKRKKRGLSLDGHTIRSHTTHSTKHIKYTQRHWHVSVSTKKKTQALHRRFIYNCQSRFDIGMAIHNAKAQCIYKGMKLVCALRTTACWCRAGGRVRFFQQSATHSKWEHTWCLKTK